ncbi:MAG: double-strand break repair protein AddB [Pseudomonadota bacterium]|nr:double-strand break repair protein AddB [Pseudomonadota bacterium]
MFEKQGAHLFGIDPGIDFPAALVAGLKARLAGQPPHAIAKVELIVNTQRMARRIEALFRKDSASFLPKIRLITHPGPPEVEAALPRPVSGLRRRLELTGLISKLLDTSPDLAPRAALFDLADSLSALMDEMQIEDVPTSVLEDLDVTDQSGHWERALTFLRIVNRYFDAADPTPDAAALQKRAIDLRLAMWAEKSPTHPIIIAGSTGSRGTTHRLMQAVAALPNGAVVLPGFDFDMPRHVWDQLMDGVDEPGRIMPAEDHPQYRFGKLLADVNATPQDVHRWTDDRAPSPERNKLVSLALRPAPVTDQWLADGPSLPSLAVATQGLTLLEATTKREEALAIALRLRQAAEDGVTAALITPDRVLTRQVTAALGRWGIVPDDSAGTPVQLSPPGRLLRHVAKLFEGDLTAEALLTILKHPLCHAGAERGDHVLMTNKLELKIRREGWAYPKAEDLLAWCATQERADWGEWIVRSFMDQRGHGERALSVWLDHHISLTEQIVAGSRSEDSSALWDKKAGRAVREIVDDLISEAPYGTDLSASDYGSLFGSVLAKGEVRDRDEPHPHIRIWGTMEARVMGADLLILSSLNEGTWPQVPPADPWLNRRMRADSGLLLPERSIGLSAHDFQQAIAGKDVWLTRAAKSDDVETVPSRWVNRLLNLMNGLPDNGGPDAVKEMRSRAKPWLDYARQMDAPIPALRAHRPSPRPPVSARPRELPVTQIKTLIRDPYAVYAQRVLKLRPLNPLQRIPDALMRGIAVHDILETYIKRTVADPSILTRDQFMAEAKARLAEIPFPLVRKLWEARLDHVATSFVTEEIARQNRARPKHFEVSGKSTINELGFTLTAKADRVDIDERGGAWIYDYKTGKPPSVAEQEHFDKQMLLEAALVERNGFEAFEGAHFERAIHIGLKAGTGEQEAPTDKIPPAQVWQELTTLIAAYLDEAQGFTSRRAVQMEGQEGDYDHLARLGEWQPSDEPVQEILK